MFTTLITFPPSSSTFIREAMRRRSSTIFFILISVFVFASISLHLSRKAISAHLLFPLSPNLTFRSSIPNPLNLAVQDHDQFSHASRREKDRIDGTVSVLFPDWEVIVFVASSPEIEKEGDGLYCLFSTKEYSPAKLTKSLPSSNRTTFKCLLPRKVRRRMPFLQPILTRTPDSESPLIDAPELLRWKFLAYEAMSTDEDVLLFIKGVNNRQGVNRPASDFRCVFGSDGAVKTTVTSSAQEVFRCRHPDLEVASYSYGKPIKVTLEVTQENWLIPSVAQYAPPLTIAELEQKHLICACTMVYNVSKFLREWVMYHSKIGVEKFILYNNNEEIDDDLESATKELNEQGYEIDTFIWIWSKAQEAGFSHSVKLASKSCTWMMYLDIDEFLFSPSWLKSSQPSKDMIKSLLPDSKNSSVGQVSMKCNDFGPSNQKTHPPQGVIQGYTCRKMVEQRHKSIVLLDAVDNSLLNVIHHFELKQGYVTKTLGLDEAVVNHYKYQAWPEFQTKFRRRVSAYVVDWTQAINLNSQDRTPGLGSEPIEPEDWAMKFCEVEDDRLKLLAQRWFGSSTSSGLKMAWQR